MKEKISILLYIIGCLLVIVAFISQAVLQIEFDFMTNIVWHWSILGLPLGILIMIIGLCIEEE